PLTPELDDPRMVGAVQEYLDSLETGIRPNRQAFLARYQEPAEPLAECLDALEFVHMVGPRLEGPVGGLGRLRRRRLPTWRCHWVIFASSGRSAGAAWASYTRQNNSPLAGA